MRSDALLALERMPPADAFEAFLDELASLRRRSNDWAFAFIMRTLNTRGSTDDVAGRFERAVKKRGDAAKRLVGRVLRDAAPELPPELRDVVVTTLRNLGQPWDDLG